MKPQMVMLRLASSWLAVALTLEASLLAGHGDAACNLIPAAERTFPSTLGSISSPVTAPGKTVEIHLDPRCDASPGFDSGTPANNAVTLTFEPPGGATTDVAIAGVTVDDALTLRFVVPDTDSLLSPDGDGLGLAGPALIRVRGPSSVLLAEIGPLFEPTVTCDRVSETVFRQLTVLPPANVFADLASGASTRILATLDGGRNLLVPLQYLAVLPEGPGSPVARLLEGRSSIEAFSGGGTPIQIPSSEFVRSFTLDGRPLPPLLRVNSLGNLLFGTVDAIESVIRVARSHGGSADIFELTDRLSMGRGPIVIDKFTDGFEAMGREPLPLRGLRSSGQTVAFARDEQIEGDLNGDGDDTDRLIQLIDVQTGARTMPNLPLVEVSRDGFSGLALETTGTLAAFLESEAAQGHTDVNGDGDAFDSILRVFTSSGTNLTAADTGADPAPVLNGRSLVVSGPLVFFRSREGDDFPRITERVSLDDGGSEANDASGSPAISADGRFVAFASLAYNLIPGTNGASLCVGGTPNGIPQGGEPCDDGNTNNGDGCDTGCHVEVARAHVLVYDREANAVERVSVSASGELADADAFEPVISADGRFVAFSSLAGNLVTGDSSGFSDVFVYDRASGSIERVSVGGGGVQGNADSVAPAITSDGRFVAFTSLAGNLVPLAGNGQAQIYVRDRTSGTTERVSLSSDGLLANASALDPAISADGRFVAFVSSATNLVAGDGDGNGARDVFVRDRALGSLERVSVSSAGVEANDDSLDVSITADGRVVAFNSWATNLVAGDSNAREDVFVFDRNTRLMERVSLDDEGVEGNDSSVLPLISSDGRFVAFESFATNLVPGDLNGKPDVFVYDRDTNAIERVSVDGGGAEANGLSTLPVLSTDGRHVAFVSDATNLAGAGADTNGVDDVFVHGIGSGTSLNGDGDIADTVLQVFDTITSTLRPAARIAASVVAIADGRAVTVTSEADEGGLDLNADGDPYDVVAQLYDGVLDTRVSLGRAATRVAISSQLIALTVSEAQQAETDLNADGDTVDDVLGVQAIGAPPGVVNVGLAADAIAVVDQTVVFITPEASEDTTDLNGDRDTADRVLRIYDHDTGRTTEVGVAAEDFVAGGHLVAFRVPEADQGNTDLNGDGDTLDLVMFVYDLATGTLVSTGQAAVLCTLPGCEPFTPYKVKGDTVSFLVREADQGGVDLNGDGDALDFVMQVFNIRTGTLQVFNPSSDAPQLNPLPEDLVEAPILYVEASEVAQGRDLNGDGDQTDVVILLGSDADADDTFDDFDSCVEQANADQEDSDLDGLGDACDPTAFCGEFVPSAPPVPPSAALDCQDAVRKAALKYLKTRAAALRSCLNRMASGRLSGDSSGVCRGHFVGGVDALPEDRSTARKLARAAEKLRSAVAKSCSPGAVSLLDSCGSTPDQLADCVLVAYGTAAIVATRLAYGDVAPIPDRTTKGCQSVAGQASATYLASVVDAMQRCLGRFAAGSLAGNSQELCLGSLGTSGVVAPTDASTRLRVLAAEAKLRFSLSIGCPGSTLAALDTCGANPPSAGDCLECTHWRHAVEAVRSVYGPS